MLLAESICGSIPVYTRASFLIAFLFIFIKHKPFSSQLEDKSPIEVEDKSGFPLKACGNDKPYILCLLTYCLYYNNRAGKEFRIMRFSYPYSILESS